MRGVEKDICSVSFRRRAVLEHLKQNLQAASGKEAGALERAGHCVNPWCPGVRHKAGMGRGSEGTGKAEKEKVKN